MKSLVSSMLDIARLTLRFGQVERVTLHPDGHPETDSTHTVMLGLLAVGLARYADLPLDQGLVAVFALVHDLAEAYAGDTNTARRLDADGLREKALREAAALELVREDLEAFPNLLTLLDDYELQEIPEARFVRYVDKLTPKLTHILDGGMALRRLKMTMPEVVASHRQQGEELRAEYPEFDDVARLFDVLCEESEQALKEVLDEE